jgi:hypothetical protein
MDKDPLGSAAVKGVLTKVQLLRIAHLVLYRQLLSLRTFAGFSDQGRAIVYANHVPSTADHARQGLDVIARAAANI